MKKLISILCVIALLPSAAFSVHADGLSTTVSCDNERKAITVAGGGGISGGKAVFFSIYAVGDESSSDPCIVEVTRTSDDGSFELDILPPEDFSGGKYMLKSSSSFGADTDYFMWVNDDNVVECLPYINKTTSAPELETYMSSHMSELGIDSEQFEPNKKPIAEILFANIPSEGFSEANGFVKAYNAALAIALIKNGSDCSETLSKYRSAFEGIDENYFGLSSEVRTEMDRLILEYDFSHATITKAISELRIKAFINTSYTWDVMKNAILGLDSSGQVVNNNFSIIAPDVTYYNKLINKDKVFMKLFESKSQLVDIEALKKYFEQYSEEQYKDETKGNSTGSGGGSVSIIAGSGGSKAEAPKSTTAPLASPIPESQKNDDDEYVFNDTSSHWASNAISLLYKRGIVNGYEDNLFKPDNTLTRAEFATVLYKVFNTYGSSEQLFDDVNSDDWFYTAVSSLASDRVLLGNDGHFYPNAPLTRQDACVILYRCIDKYTDINTDPYASVATSDINEVSDYASDAVNFMLGTHLMQGMEDGRFAPNETVTRAQMAQLLKNYVEYSGDDVTSHISLASDVPKGVTRAEKFYNSLALLEAIGVDTEALQNESVTRIEFTKMLVQACKWEQIGIDNICYEDITADTYGGEYVNTALTHGIIEQSSSFNPDQPIILIDAVKMALAATGYLKAMSDNYTDSDYLKLAYTTFDIGSVSKGTANDAISSETAAAIIYNMLTVDLMEQVQFGINAKYEVKKDKTILNEYHEVEKIEGIVTADEYTSLTSSAGALSDDKIMIGTQIFDCYLQDKCLGYNVKAYYKDVYGAPTVICIEKSSRNKTYEVTADSVDTFENRTLKYTRENGSTGKIKFADSFNYIYNGKKRVLEEKDLSDNFDFDIGSFFMIDDNNDGLCDTVFATEYDYCNVKSVSKSTKIIFDKFSSDRTLDLSEDDCKYYIKRYSEGEFIDIDISDITPEDIIEFTASEDRLLYKMTVYDNYVIGRSTQVNKEDHSITIDGKEYKLHSAVLDIFSGSPVSSEGVFLLSLDGTTVVGVDLTATGSMYGWVLKTGMEEGGEDSVWIKLFTQDEESKLYLLASKVKINGVSKKITSDAQVEELFTSDDRLIKFRLNSDNKVSDMYLPEATISLDEYAENSFDERLAKCHSGTYTMRTYTNFVGGFYINDGTYNFIVPQNKSLRTDAEKFKVITKTGSFYLNGTSYNVTSYDEDESGNAKVTLCYAADYEDKNKILSKTSDLYPVVVEDVSSEMNDDNEIVYKLFVCDGQEYHTLYADYEKNALIAEIAPGDIIRYTSDNDDNITGIRKDFDFSEKSFTDGLASYKGAEFGTVSFSYVGGYLYNKGSKNLMLLASDYIGDEVGNKKFEFADITNVPVIDSRCIYVKVSLSGKKKDNITTYRGLQNNVLYEYRYYKDSPTFVVASMHSGTARTTIYYDIR